MCALGWEVRQKSAACNTRQGVYVPALAGACCQRGVVCVAAVWTVGLGGPGLRRWPRTALRENMLPCAPPASPAGYLLS